MIETEYLDPTNIKIYQDKDLYCFTSDALRLAEFTKVKKDDVVADFCAGSGVVGFYLYGLNQNQIENLTFFEMQKPLFELSKKSIELNRLENKIFAENVKLQEIDNRYFGRFSLIVCNPPYMPTENGFCDKDENIAICRSEKMLKLDELLSSVSKCLKYGGRVCLVHRADRLIDVICGMREKGIEPKRLQFCSAKNKDPYLFFIEGVKGGKSGLKVLSAIKN